MTTTTLSISALSGIFKVGWTVAKKREAGRPPSLWMICERTTLSIFLIAWTTYLAKAKIIRLLVVITLMMANTKHTKGNLFLQCQHSWFKRISFETYIKRQIAPALLLVASMRICSRGPAADVVTFSMFPATNRRTIKKMDPVTVPIPTQETMIFGPSTSALGTSDWNVSVFLPFHHCNILPSIICATAS